MCEDRVQLSNGILIDIPQQSDSTGNNPVMWWVGIYISHVSKLGIPQQCVRIGCSSVCNEIGKCSAMY